MKHAYLMVLALFSGYLCLSQNRSYLSLSAGAAIPFRNFSNKDVTKNSSGLAGVGQSLNITYQNVAANKVGFAMELKGSRFPLANKAVEKKLNDTPIEDFGLIRVSHERSPAPQTTYTTYNNWQVKKSSYLSAALLAGVCAEIPAFDSKNIFFNARVLAGGVYFKLAEFDGTASTATSALRYQESDDTGFGFMYTVGGALHFRSDKKLFFTTGIDFLGTNNIRYSNYSIKGTQVKGRAGETDYQAGGYQLTGDVMFKVTAMNIVAGVGLRL